uniref:Secreted protein n=1 Tax=Arundo donax TaxID=35708 RepID=A0A0A9H4C7_ARUDO
MILICLVTNFMLVLPPVESFVMGQCYLDEYNKISCHLDLFMISRPHKITNNIFCKINLFYSVSFNCFKCSDDLKSTFFNAGRFYQILHLPMVK